MSSAFDDRRPELIDGVYIGRAYRRLDRFFDAHGVTRSTSRSVYLALHDLVETVVADGTGLVLYRHMSLAREAELAESSGRRTVKILVAELVGFGLVEVRSEPTESRAGIALLPHFLEVTGFFDHGERPANDARSQQESRARSRPESRARENGSQRARDEWQETRGDPRAEVENRAPCGPNKEDDDEDSSSSLSSRALPPGPTEVDVDELLGSVWTLIARQRLARREAEKGRVGHRGRWLAETVRNVPRDADDSGLSFDQRARGLLAMDPTLTAGAVADRLENAGHASPAPARSTGPTSAQLEMAARLGLGFAADFGVDEAIDMLADEFTSYGSDASTLRDHAIAAVRSASTADTGAAAS